MKNLVSCVRISILKIAHPRENSEDARNFDFYERLGVSHDKFREGEDVRENSVFRCEDAVHREDILTSASNIAGKKEIDDSRK